jgi:large subunit ribosomal protein L11e
MYELLEAVLKVKSYLLDFMNIGLRGCLSLSVKNHLDMGLKYDPEVGIFVLQFSLVFEKSGYRVARRRRRARVLPTNFRIGTEDTRSWLVECS